MRTLQYVKEKILEKYNETIICLSTKYINNKSKLSCRCNTCQHKWLISFNDLSSGHGCPKCSKRIHKQPEEILSLVHSRGGQVLSMPEKIRLNIKFLVKCKNGHEFKTSCRALFHDKTWCPICKSNIEENFCRKILETLFKEKFPSVRPHWLKNKNGNTMQLDGYCCALNLAFEYNGEQHYKNIKFFKEKAVMIQKRDQEKANLCSTLNIKLIVIPYTVSRQNVESFIRIECERLGITVPNDDKIDIKNLKVYSTKLKEFQQLCLAHNVECKSTQYIGAFKHMNLKCLKCENEWVSSPINFKKHPNCSKCQKRKETNGT